MPQPRPQATIFGVVLIAEKCPLASIARLGHVVGQSGSNSSGGACHAVFGGSFEFLGYRFEAGRRYVRTSSRRVLKERVRQLTRRSGGQSLEHVIAGLNPLLRGWFA